MWPFTQGFPSSVQHLQGGDLPLGERLSGPGQQGGLCEQTTWDHILAPTSQGISLSLSVRICKMGLLSPCLTPPGILGRLSNRSMGVNVLCRWLKPVCCLFLCDWQTQLRRIAVLVKSVPGQCTWPRIPACLPPLGRCPGKGCRQSGLVERNRGFLGEGLLINHHK